MEWLEKSLQEDFDLPPKHPSEEALRRWRSAVSLVKNRRRRFRMVADLDTRTQNEERRRSVQVRTYTCSLHLPLVNNLIKPTLHHPPLLLSLLTPSVPWFHSVEAMRPHMVPPPPDLSSHRPPASGLVTLSCICDFCLHLFEAIATIPNPLLLSLSSL
jgi:hypothetical protein